MGLVINGAVAAAALVGLRHARRDTRAAQARAAAAENALSAQRARLEAAHLARMDLDALQVVLRHHAARTDKNVWLNPGEIGEIRTSLAMLPSEMAPTTRAHYGEDGAGGGFEVVREVSDELVELVRELRAKAAAAA